MIDKTQEGKLTILTINNPPMNVLCTALLEELSAVLDEVLKDESNVVILTGEGRAFVAGADISEMKPMSSEEAVAFSEKGQEVFNKIDNFPKPVIAAVNGFALGGGTELAMACDIRIASAAAKFGQPEVGLGVIPGFGGTQRLPRLVGAGKAMELILTGDIIDAKIAQQIGLVQLVVDGYKRDENGELVKNEKGKPVQDNSPVMEAARVMAGKIVSKGPGAIRWAKEAMGRGIDTDQNSGLSIEADLFGNCFETEDQKEGMAAFLERRKPEFKDR